MIARRDKAAHDATAPAHQVETPIPVVALLGCSEGYGRAVAACLASALGDRLVLTNRHHHVVRRLATYFPHVGTDNGAAVRQAVWIGILVRPDQVHALLSEISPHLRPDHLLLNLTARHWKLPSNCRSATKLDLALTPPIGGTIHAAFYRRDAAVAPTAEVALVSLLRRVARHVIPTDDSVAEMTLMARSIAHFSAYARGLISEGHTQQSVVAHFEHMAAALRETPIEEILTQAFTKGGITSAVAQLFARDPAFKTWVARERATIAPWLVSSAATGESLEHR